MVVWTLALDVIEDVRGSIAMYLFIIEEAIQTLGMACYMSYKAKNMALARELAQYGIDNVINPAIEFNNAYGFIAYPLNMAYDVFYKNAKKTFETYLTL